jgi:hypothetical protein
LRIERGADLARPLVAVERRDGPRQIAVAHQIDGDIGGVAAVSHGDVEMRNSRANIGDHPGKLRLSIRTRAAGGEDPHRHVVFSDAIDPAGEMIFGAERGLEESVCYLAVGEGLPLGALT